MANELYCFDHFGMDVERRTLLRDGEILPLPQRAFDTLKFLVLNAGRIVSKDELITAVWGDTAVLESNLAHQIMALRSRLGSGADGQPLIRSAARQGYYLAVRVTKKLVEQKPAPADPARAQELPPDDPLRREIESSVPGFPHAETCEPDPDDPPRKKFECILPEDTFVAQQSRPPFRPLTSRTRMIPALAGIAASLLFAAKLLPTRPELAPFPPIGRLLTRATSEGWQPKLVKLSHPATYLAISLRGDKVFAAEALGRTLSILSTANGSVRTLALPQAAASLAVSPDGKLYIGSQVDGIMVLDIDSGRLLPTIPAGGPVRGMAITPDGSQLFLAMSTNGLKRLSTGPGKLTPVSDRICPERLEMDRQGKNLYVAYQCSGPTGRPGHDSVGIFDVESGASLGFVTGPPMVGGPPSVSPDGKLVLLDGADACWSPQYDHQGCMSAPSHVFHLLDPLGRQILHSFEFSRWHGQARFLDNSRFLLLGDSVSVVDAARYSVPERWNNAEDCGATDIVLARDGRRAYLGCVEKNTILVLQPEGAECSPPQHGLAMYYAADGTTADGAGVTELTPHGNPRFTAGRVGQAFFLDGSSYLSTSWTGYYRLGLSDSTLALYVKFAGIGGEMALADWTDEKPRLGIRLLKSAGNRFVFQTRPDGSPLESKTLVRPDIWYHLVVTRTGQDLTLYINGKPESHGTPPPPFNQQAQPRLFLGAHSPGQPSFHGWLDEIAFYDRALTAKEVEDMYQLRESGPCKL
jgi:DNA-binding winged helix-turn-helix (wHTH) protein/DNA-binding beta-propeller fold protein YncE